MKHHSKLPKLNQRPSHSQPLEPHFHLTGQKTKSACQPKGRDSPETTLKIIRDIASYHQSLYQSHFLLRTLSLSLSLSLSLPHTHTHTHTHVPRAMAAGKQELVASTVPSSKFDVELDSPKKPGSTKYATIYALLASMTSILLGYDIGVMSGALIYIKDDLKISEVQVEVLAGILNLYCLIGSCAAGRTSDWIGRRYTILVSQTIFFAGALLMGFATNYSFLMFGRLIAGIGAGYAAMIAPVYTAEVAPASSRGLLTSFFEVFINFGILLGYVSNFAFSKLPAHLGWRFMLGVAAVPSVFLGLVVLGMPESPRWLVLHGRLGDAKRVLEKISETKENAHSRLADIKEAAGIPLDCNDDVVTVSKNNQGDGVWRDLLLHPTPAVRHMLITAIGIHFFQQASGIDSVVLYSPRIFEKAGIRSANQKLLATIAVGSTKTVFILTATFLLDRIGRRRLILSSVAGMVASLVALGFSLTIINNNPSHKVTWAIVMCVLTVLLYVMFFSIGLGPIPCVYCSEIFPLRLRAQGVSFGIAVNRVTSGVITMTFISLYSAITIGGTFFLYAGIAAVAWVFFYTLLPETKGRTLEDMEGLFGNFRGRNKGVDGLKKGSGNDSNTIQL